MEHRQRRKLRQWLSIGVIAAAIVVVVLLALIWGGVLVLRSGAPAPVTISSVHLVIQERNTTNGGPWLGPWSINYTEAEGFPLQVAPGSTFSIVWETIINFDNVNHTISKVSPSHPFTIASTLPALPFTIPADSEGGNLAISVATPSTPGATYAVLIVVDALATS